MREARACDGLKRNMVNLATAVLSPITLPTWGHIAKLARNVAFTKLEWVLINGGHESAYKQHPLDPKYASMDVFALRCRLAKKWRLSPQMNFYAGPFLRRRATTSPPHCCGLSQ